MHEKIHFRNTITITAYLMKYLKNSVKHKNWLKLNSMKSIRQIAKYYLQDFNIFYLNLPVLSYFLFYSKTIEWNFIKIFIKKK